MTKKLTKNDSMSKKQSYFDVCVASFEAFLEKENSHGFYFHEWAEQNKCADSANIFYDWREWARYRSPLYWVNNAFTWCSSDKGYAFWSRISDNWVKYHTQYINS